MDGGEIALVSIVSVLALISIVIAGVTISKIPSTGVAGTSAGVLSAAATWAEFFTSVTVAYLPISLIWIGVILSIVTANTSFFIPTFAAVFSISTIMILEAFLPAK
jgi:hypothetical protein